METEKNIQGGVALVKDTEVDDTETGSSGSAGVHRPPFRYATVSADTWAKIVCHAKYIELYLGCDPAASYGEGDIIVFTDEAVPSAKAICRITKKMKYADFSVAFANVYTHGLGYIGREVQSAKPEDYEWDYPKRKILEHGVVALEWELLSAEYVKPPESRKPESRKPKKSKKPDEVDGTASTEAGNVQVRADAPQQSTTEGSAPADCPEPTSASAPVDPVTSPLPVRLATQNPEQPSGAPTVVYTSGEHGDESVVAHAIRKAMATVKTDSTQEGGE